MPVFSQFAPAVPFLALPALTWANTFFAANVVGLGLTSYEVGNYGRKYTKKNWNPKATLDGKAWDPMKGPNPLAEKETVRSFEEIEAEAGEQIETEEQLLEEEAFRKQVEAENAKRQEQARVVLFVGLIFLAILVMFMMKKG